VFVKHVDNVCESPVQY